MGIEHYLKMSEFADVMNNSTSLKFDTLKKLNKNINGLINYNIHMQKKEAENSEIQNLNHPTIVGDEVFKRKYRGICEF